MKKRRRWSIKRSNIKDWFRENGHTGGNYSRDEVGNKFGVWIEAGI